MRKIKEIRNKITESLVCSVKTGVDSRGRAFCYIDYIYKGVCRLRYSVNEEESKRFIHYADSEGLSPFHIGEKEFIRILYNYKQGFSDKLDSWWVPRSVSSQELPSLKILK